MSIFFKERLCPECNAPEYRLVLGLDWWWCLNCGAKGNRDGSSLKEEIEEDHL
jgi:hypothetical protein